MKIYTKKGDKGKTALIGGERVFKDNLRIDAYGTVDELNAQLGLVICTYEPIRIELKEIQDQLFNLGSHLANSKESKFKLPEINPIWITKMEENIDLKTAQLPELKNFILPGSDIANAHCHVARCICRRAERLCVSLDRQEGIEAIIIIYLNRLSDYLFTLSRFITHQIGTNEVIWKP